jgi:hypothetical protein
MISELGHYALMLALGLALIQAILPIIGTRTGDAVLMNMAAPTRTGVQQSLSDHGMRHRVRRHALSARARGAYWGKDFRRPAVLQCDFLHGVGRLVMTRTNLSLALSQ